MKSDNQKSIWFALSLAWELGYLIAIPVVLLALLGRLLDKRFETSPWLLLLGILLSLIVSSWLIYYRVIKILSSELKNTKTSEKKN